MLQELKCYTIIAETDKSSNRLPVEQGRLCPESAPADKHGNKLLYIAITTTHHCDTSSIVVQKEAAVVTVRQVTSITEQATTCVNCMFVSKPQYNKSLYLILLIIIFFFILLFKLFFFINFLIIIVLIVIIVFISKSPNLSESTVRLKFWSIRIMCKVCC